jgi:RHS repeat-associated protein
MGDVILEDRCTELLDNSHPAKQAASTDKVVSIGSNNNAATGELQSNAGSILYLHEPSAFRPLAQIRSEQTGEDEQTESIYYYHLDHIGTPLELTDEQGRIVWQANYSGFGQARIINSGITNLIRYPGQYEDSEIGLHYNRFRYYDPSSGQYTQQDPIGLMGGEQLSQYVADPVNWVDVLGLQGDCDAGEAVIRQYKNGYAEGHFTIEVRHKDLSYSKHQVITSSGSREQTTIMRSGSYQTQRSGDLVKETTVPLPNARAAIDYQRNKINEPLGPYDVTKNSCVTHVCDVIKAGGGKAYSSSRLGLGRFFKDNGFGRLDADKSILRDN